MSFSPLYIFMCVTIGNSIHSLSLSFLRVFLIIGHSTQLICLPRWLSGKESAGQCRTHKRHRFNPRVGKIPLEEEMAAHSSILAWEIPWTEEPGRLQSMGSQESDMPE